ncbi:MAG: hypothetical protein ABIT01_20520 [Thermoanaerobaculia bacterium]
MKAAAVKVLKVSPREVGASVIRDVRKKMGIDRPSALSHARAVLAKDPNVEARKVIDAIRERFGIRLGPPDVSRLRPRTASTGRGRPAKRGRRPKAAVAARPAAAPAAQPAVAAKSAAAPARKGRRPAKKGRRANAGKPAAASAVTSSPAPAPAMAAAPKRGRGRPRSAPKAEAVAAAPKGGEISMTFEGKGNPADLAAFFLSLSTKR